jgi:hypothetical protein
MCLRLITYFRSRRTSGFANIVTMVALPVALETMISTRTTMALFLV